ncbi:MAG: agmatinase [Devosiaceae bacterium]|nr:agmatinase [Devosiaceae bacterium MH13]
MTVVEASTFSSGASFLDAPTGDRTAPVCILGAPMDWATTNRAGAREGPAAIRRASRLLLDGDHPVHGTNPASLGLSDLGDVPVLIGDIAESHRRIEDAATGLAHLCTLGGDHSVALPLLRAAAKRHGPLGLVQFDAHTDTWDENFGQDLAHGTPFHHALEEGLIDPKRTIQIGIRAPMDAKLLRDTVLSRGLTILSAEDVHDAGADAVAARVIEVVGPGPTYLSFDIDALDPAFAPGTGTPEVGGLASWQARAILRRLAPVNFIGMDLVEVAPAYDHAEITALAGATMVWDYLSLQVAKLRVGA